MTEGRPLTQAEEAELKLCERCGEGLRTDAKIQGAADEDQGGYPVRLCVTCSVAGMSGTDFRGASYVRFQPDST